MTPSKCSLALSATLLVLGLLFTMVVPVGPGSTQPAAAQTGTAQPGTESANARWLTDLYREVLGREADDGGLDHWLGRLAGGGAESRERVVRTLMFSPEGSRIEVRRAYAELLGRSTDIGGENFWTDYLRSRPVTILRSNLIASDEYYAGAGANDAFIEKLYLEVLGRSVEADGLRYWSARLTDGTPRWQLVLAVYLSPESLGRRADAYALEILDRTLDRSERATAIAIIQSGGERSLRAHFLASDEAFSSYLTSVGLSHRGEQP